MVITRIGGGLGNQIFRYAIGRGLALKLNTELKLDLTALDSWKNSDHGYYVLDVFNLKETTLATKEEIDAINENEWKIITDSDQPPVSSRDNIYIKEANRIQGDNLFFDIANTIREEFTLKKPMHKIADSWRKKILAAACSVSIHIRHGSFIHPFGRSFMQELIPLEYYTTCMEELKAEFQNLTFFVFSDDLDWAKQNLKRGGVAIEFVEGVETDVEELVLMSCCTHNIISSSTFSYWGAWLNKNPNKKMFTPSCYKEAITSKINFIEIPVSPRPSYTELQLPPTISIIVYVEDKDFNIESTFISILQQTTRDYEVIIVDSSKNNVGDICRKFAGIENFNFLKVKNTVDKYEAFNIGLNCACGLYVSFLTGADFFIPNALYHLFKICMDSFEKNFFHKYSEIKQRLKFSNYEYVMNNYSPQLVLTVNRLNEDENGNAKFNDKFFEIIRDASFSDLNQFEHISLNNAEKLNLFAERKINDLLGTKFFQLNFLNENNIRFKSKEKSSNVNPALIFQVETMLLADKISVSPSILFGTKK